MLAQGSAARGVQPFSEGRYSKLLGGRRRKVRSKEIRERHRGDNLGREDEKEIRKKEGSP